MNLKPIELGKGRIAHVVDELSFGQYEDSSWLKEVFFKDAPSHSDGLYFMASSIIVGVAKWEGMGEDWEWPELKSPLSKDQPAIQKRFDSLRGFSVHKLRRIFEAIQEESEVDPKLEGN